MSNPIDVIDFIGNERLQKILLVNNSFRFPSSSRSCSRRWLASCGENDARSFAMCVALCASFLFEDDDDDIDFEKTKSSSLEVVTTSLLSVFSYLHHFNLRRPTPPPKKNDFEDEEDDEEENSSFSACRRPPAALSAEDIARIIIIIIIRISNVVLYRERECVGGVFSLFIFYSLFSKFVSLFCLCV